MVVVTLLNLDQFEFILQKNHITWNLIKLACLISSGVMNFHKKFHKNSPDFKDNCKALAAIGKYLHTKIRIYKLYVIWTPTKFLIFKIFLQFYQSCNKPAQKDHPQEN